MTIAIVQGTRPEVIKNHSIVKALIEQQIPHLVFHTNQHYEGRMRDMIYQEMQYQPDLILDQKYSLGLAIEWLQKQYKRNNITHVVVNGDTASSLAGSLAAMYLDINVSHIEAGLRSHDHQMLEERNRIMVDVVASLLFAYTSREDKILKSSTDIRGKVLVEGNTTVDIINQFKKQLNKKPVEYSYIYVTMHRRELTRSKSRLECIVSALNHISNNNCNIIFPLHPRTRDALKEFNLLNKLCSSILLIEPISAIESLQYQKHSKAILTDSGCIQEEAYMLGIPCVTLRENTERHLTVENGANKLSGFDEFKIAQLAYEAITAPEVKWPEIYGKPGAGKRIVNKILRNL